MNHPYPEIPGHEILHFLTYAKEATVVFVSEELHIGFINQAMMELWHKKEGLLHRRLIDVAPEFEPFIPILREVWTSGQPYVATDTPANIDQNGILTETFFDFEYRPVVDADGKTRAIINTATNVSARREASRLTRESEERFRLLAEGSEVMISVNDIDGNVEYVNQAWLRLTGKTQEEMQAYGWGDFLHPDDQDRLLAEFRQGIVSRAPFTVEFRMLDAGGTPHWIYTSVNPRLLADGTYTGTVSSSIDISEQIRARNEVSEVNARLQVALDAGMFGTTEVDLASGSMVCNNRFKQLFGRGEEEVMTYPDMFAAMLPKYREDIGAKSRKAQLEHAQYEANYEIMWPDGSVHWIEAHGLARYDRDGKPYKMVGILADVTEQVKARTLLEQAEANLRLATDAASLGTWYIHSESRELIANDRLRELFGFYPGETVSVASCIAQITEDFRQQVGEAIEKAITEGGDYDLSYTVKGFHDHRTRWVRAVGNLKVDVSGEFSAFTGVIMDITEQVKALQTIQESEELYRKLASELRISRDETRLAIDAASLATFDLNPAIGKFSGNDLIREWFGLKPDAEIALSDATDVIAGEDRGRVLKAINDALKYESGGHYDITYTIINPLRPVPRIVRAKGETLFNEQHEPVRLSGVLQDITEQRRDEERKDAFIGMVSHELKTPLTSTKAFVQMLLGRAKKENDQFAANALEKVNTQIGKMTTMINGFLNVSHLESGKVQLDKHRFDLKDLVVNAIDDARLTTSGHEISLLPGTPVQVVADINKIGAVISNLLSNAIKYSPKGGKIEVQCRSEKGQAIVSVRDQGMGISEADIEHLFDRYYRVENPGAKHISGFGIGLYLAAEIIQRHHGRIWVESKVGEGSVFYMSIPMV